MSIEIIAMVGTQEVSESRGTFGGPAIDAGFHESSSVGSQRLQQQAAERDVHDERLWMGVTKLTGPGGRGTGAAAARAGGYAGRIRADGPVGMSDQVLDLGCLPEVTAPGRGRRGE